MIILAYLALKVFTTHGVYAMPMFAKQQEYPRVEGACYRGIKDRKSVV